MQLLIVPRIILGDPAGTAEGTGLLDQAVAAVQTGLPTLVPLATAPIHTEQDVVHSGHIDEAVARGGGAARQVLRVGQRVVDRRVVAGVVDDEVGGVEDGEGNLLEVGEAGVAVDALRLTGARLSVSIWWAPATSGARSTAVRIRPPLPGDGLRQL